jgi:hypothetical protein
VCSSSTILSLIKPIRILLQQYLASRTHTVRILYTYNVTFTGSIAQRRLKKVHDQPLLSNGSENENSFYVMAALPDRGTVFLAWSE